MKVSITHNRCNMIIAESDGTDKLRNKLMSLSRCPVMCLEQAESKKGVPEPQIFLQEQTLGDTVRMLMVWSLFPEGTIVAGVILVRGHIVLTMLKVLPVGIDLCPSAELVARPMDDGMGRGKRTKKTLGNPSPSRIHSANLASSWFSSRDPAHRSWA
ncbi:hypothetical protein Tco_0728152 [Tanacetum coccineum]|uniref:Uncharacterized protein n=1 Tax=Tanacetum coccineum TaxID=301880 RepID=A0ABQ4YMN9_9ASTR